MTNPREKRFAESITSRKGPDERMARAEVPDPMAPRGVILEASDPDWEYMSVVLSDTANLNVFAAERWEPCGMLPRPGDKAVFHLRRRRRKP